MKKYNRVDLVPEYDIVTLGELIDRAKECGLVLNDILDIIIDGTQYKELLFTGTRWSYIKYWGLAIMKGEAEFSAIPGILKLMFM